MKTTRLALIFCVPYLTGCALLSPDLPSESPPLAGMEEPPALLTEPDDETERGALPLGSFTGVTVTDGRVSLMSLDDAPDGVLVQRVGENSPGDAAGIREDDLLLSAGDVDLSWPSEWRELELQTAPGSELRITYDRAGAIGETVVRPTPRVRAAGRASAERFREEQRVGVVLRTATEVEARAVGMAPGAGAVVVGLTRESPWRAAGLRFGDLIATVDGEAVAHPQVLLDAIRNADEDGSLALTFRRDGQSRDVAAPLSHRLQELRSSALWPFYSYESDRGESELSILMGLVNKRSTSAAWEWSFLWLFTIQGGDSDRLEEAAE